jgi:hypothetical protein
MVKSRTSRRKLTVIGVAQSDGIEGVAFGDLFPADVRQYRERMIAENGDHAGFPLMWATHRRTEVVHYVGIIRILYNL